MTPRSTTLRTEGCRSLEKGVEQAPEQPWKPRPRRNSPGQPLGCRWGWKKGIGMGTMEHEECRGRADNSPAAAPLQPSLRTPAPPGLPMEGQRTAGKGPEGDGTHFLKPEGRKKEPTPRTPMKRLPPSGYRRKRSASRTVCHSEKSSQQGNPRRAASRNTPSGNCRCTKSSRRNTPRRLSKRRQRP